MRYLLSLGVMLAWALWFGGLMTLFVLINAVFHAFGATQEFFKSAQAIFGYFGLYQLVLASFCMLLTVLWLLSGRTRRKWTVLSLIFVSSAAAIVSMGYVTPQMLKYIPGDAVFVRLHAMSLILYVGQSILLLLTGFLLPAEIARELKGSMP